MDKLVGESVHKIMGAGEKKAPVKSIKLKVKFDTGKGKDSEDVKHKKKSIARKMYPSGPTSPNYR